MAANSIVLRTFGCRVNQAEAFAWAEAFQRRGLRLETDPRRGDIVVVNSCTLTARADRDIRKFLLKTARENPEAAIIVTGCLAERAAGEIAELPGVRLVVGNAGKGGLIDQVLALAAGRETAGSEMVTATAPANPVNPEMVTGTDSSTNQVACTYSGKVTGTDSTEMVNATDLPPDGERGGGSDEVNHTAIAVNNTNHYRPFRSRALLKIQDGCDARCAYCIIPSVRGRGSSVPPDEIEASVRHLAGQGFCEIALAGIHLSSYGAGLNPPSSLLGLLRRLEAVEGDWMLRLSSLDPRRVDDALLDYLVSSPRICPHFHLSLQHASPRVLRDMGRPFPAAAAARLLEHLRAGRPDAALGADVIVGFPTEADEDFEILRDFVERSPLTYLHVFPFSLRPGTAAAGLPGLPRAVIASRAKALRDISYRKRHEFRRGLIGREFDGVVILARGGAVQVLTGNYVPVSVPDCAVRPRERATVRITGLGGRGAVGLIVEPPCS